MVLIHEIITENKRWDIYNESWLVEINRNSLDRFVC